MAWGGEGRGWPRPPAAEGGARLRAAGARRSSQPRRHCSRAPNAGGGGGEVGGRHGPRPLWPRVRRCARRKELAGGGRARAPPRSKPDGARARSRGSSGECGRSRGPRSGGGGGGAGNGPERGPRRWRGRQGLGASGRRGPRGRRRERVRAAGGLGAGAAFPGSPAPPAGSASPGNSRGPGGGAGKLCSWPRARRPVRARPRSRGGRRASGEPGDRAWVAAPRCPLGRFSPRTARSCCRGRPGRRRAQLLASRRCLPARCSRDSRTGKASRERDGALAPPEPQAGSSVLVVALRGPGSSDPRPQPSLYPEPEPGLAFSESWEAASLSSCICLLLGTVV